MKSISVAKPGDLVDMIGPDIAVSEWIHVTQDMVDMFADATSDHQWIHVDVERAESETEFQSTIAHGFLTLSLLSKFLNDTIDLGKSEMGINYGLNRVRFTSPVKTGDRVRARFDLIKVDNLEGGVQLEWNVCVEIDGQDKPALVAEWLTRRYG